MASAQNDPVPQENTPEITIRDLLSYKMNVVANAMSGGAAIRYRKQHNVSLGEWRALALIAASASLSLNALARAANLDKGQMSRVISMLVARGLVERQSGTQKGRMVKLELTPHGQEVYRGLIEAANDRNKAFLAALTPHENAALHSALDKLFAVARDLARRADEAL